MEQDKDNSEQNDVEAQKVCKQRQKRGGWHVNIAKLSMIKIQVKVQTKSSSVS